MYIKQATLKKTIYEDNKSITAKCEVSTLNVLLVFPLERTGVVEKSTSSLLLIPDSLSTI